MLKKLEALILIILLCCNNIIMFDINANELFYTKNEYGSYINGDESVTEYLNLIASDLLSEEKVTTTLPDLNTIDDNKLIIIIKQEFSNPFYHMTTEHFPNINIVELKEYLKVEDDNIGLINFGEYRSILVMKFANISELENAVYKLENRNDVKSISYNSEIEIYDDPILSELNSSDSINLYSTEDNFLNDPKNDNYYFKDMQMDKAWEITKGSREIKMGILDNGCNIYHEDLADNIWVNPNEIPDNGIDDDNNGYIDDINGWNFTANNNDIFEESAHGTACASVAGAVGNNSIGMSGSSPKISLVIFKVIGSGFKSENYIDIIDYAHNKNIFILSMSYGAGYNDIVYTALKNFNGLLVASAGNTGQNNDEVPHYPSNYDIDNLIAVASSDSRGYLSGHEVSDTLSEGGSNYGKETVDLAAAGTNVNICKCSNGELYGISGGTSISTPLVGGVVALLKAYQPNAIPLEIKQVLLDTVNIEPLTSDGGSLENFLVSGGRVNAYKALAKMKELYPREIIWNFGETQYQSLGTISKNLSKNYLTFHATSLDYMSVENCDRNVNGINYKGRLQLVGDGNLDERSLSFDVCGNTSIYITANATDDRILNIADSQGVVIGTINITPNIIVYRYDYIGTGDEIYIYSEDSNINIYELAIREQNNVNSMGINKEWLFSNSAFDGYTNITSATEIDGLTIMNGTLANNNLYVDDIKYTKYLGLGYAGRNDYCTVKFDVPGDCNISVVGRSTGSDERNIVVVNEQGYVIGTIPVTNTATMQTVKYTGGADTLYIRSQDSGIRLYDIKVSTVESEPRIIRSDRTGYDVSTVDLTDTYTVDEVTSGSAVMVMNLYDNENTEYKYYDQLSTDEKVVYNLLYKKLITDGCCYSNMRVIYNNTDCDDTEDNRLLLRKNVKSALSVLMNDYPQLSSIYSFDYCFDSVDDVIESMDIFITKFDEFGNTSTTTSVYNMVNGNVNSIISDIDNDEIRFESDYDKILQIIELLNDQYELVDVNSDYNYQNTAAGALISGYADSFGVARTFKLLCDNADIDCIYAEGYAGNTNSAFNIVQLEGEWFICDVCSDNILVELPSNYELLNPSIYGDLSSNVRAFTYPELNDDNYLVLGDVDLNGTLEANDAALALQYTLNSSAVELNTKQLLRADVDFNGSITAADSAAIQQMVLNGGASTYMLSLSDEAMNYEEFVEIYNAMSDQLGTDYITVEEVQEIFNF